MVNYEIVKRYADKLRNEFSGTDIASPDEMLRRHDIVCLDYDFGKEPDSIKALIHKNNRCVCALINQYLCATAKRIVKYHEFFHYYLKHLDQAVCTFRDTELTFSSGLNPQVQMENEANYLLAEYVLDTAETIEVISNYPLGQAAKQLLVPVEILKFKCKLLEEQKLIDPQYRVSYNAESTFLSRIDYGDEYFG